MSYGEQIALRGHADLEEVASATGLEVRSTAEDQFLERLRRGEVAAFERLVAEHRKERRRDQPARDGLRLWPEP